MRIIGTIFIFTFGLVTPALAIDDGTAEVDAEAEWEDDGEVEYCGGGEMSVVEEAWYEYTEGAPEVARQLLADRLKRGEVRAWEKAAALSLLAHIQLEMGDDRPAAYNYARAIELEPELSHTTTRLGHVAALFRLGRYDEALALSRAHIREACTAGQSTLECYGAYVIVSQLTEDETELFESMRSAESIRSAHPTMYENHGWLLTSLHGR